MENLKIFGIPIDRFYIIMVILIVMWLILMGFFYLKADEVTKDPCSICSERMGEEVTCYTSGMKPLKRTYYPDYSIKDD